jgi:hypothetical protein
MVSLLLNFSTLEISILGNRHDCPDKQVAYRPKIESKNYLEKYELGIRKKSDKIGVPLKILPETRKERH